jgi:hypothetical protein
MRIETSVQSRIDSALGSFRPAAAVWPSAGQILVVAERFGRPRWHHGPRVVIAQRVVAIKASDGALEWARKLSPSLVPGYSSGVINHTAVFVFQLAHRKDRATVMTVSSSGAIRTHTVPLAKGGYGSYPAQLVVTSSSTRGHAYLVTADGVIYSVDPISAQTVRHVVATPASAPDMSPPDLLPSVAPLGENIVVSSVFRRPNGLPAAGIYVIDPSRWTVRIVERTTPAWLVADNALITYTVAGQFRLPSSWKTRGTGVRIYDERGDLRAHLYARQAFDAITVTPAFALATLPGSQNEPAPPPHTPAQFRAPDESVRLHELLFNPSTGRSLGSRVEIGVLPGLIQPPQAAPHR